MTVVSLGQCYGAENPACLLHREITTRVLTTMRHMPTVALIGIKRDLGYDIFPELVKFDAIGKIHVLSPKKKVFRRCESTRFSSSRMGLHMEPVGGFQKPHGFYAEPLYISGTGDVPVAYTSKTDIALSIIELIKLTLKDPNTPHIVLIVLQAQIRVRRKIVEIFNNAARGKTHINPELLNDEHAKELFSGLAFESPKGEQHRFDEHFTNELATRGFTMRGGGGNLDFTKNDSELVNPAESTWEWTGIEEFAKKTDGMSIEMEDTR